MGVIPRGNNKFSFFWFPACAVPLASLEGTCLNWVFQQPESSPDQDLSLYILPKFIPQWASKEATNTSFCILKEDECTDRKALWQMDLEESPYNQEASWMQPLPYHRILSVSLCQLETQSSLLVSGQIHLDKSCDIYSVIQTHVWWFSCSPDSFSC